MLYVAATHGADVEPTSGLTANYGVTITGWAQHPLPPELPVHYELYRPAQTTHPSRDDRTRPVAAGTAVEAAGVVAAAEHPVGGRQLAVRQPVPAGGPEPVTLGACGQALRARAGAVSG